MFIKLLLHGAALTLDRLNPAYLKYLAERKLKFLRYNNKSPFNEITRNVLLFYKTNTTGRIEYVVAKIDSVFQISIDKNNFLDDLMMLQNQWLRCMQSTFQDCQAGPRSAIGRAPDS